MDKVKFFRTLLSWTAGISLFLILGLIGGVEHGAPISNLLLSIPLMGIAVICVQIIKTKLL